MKRYTMNVSRNVQLLPAIKIVINVKTLNYYKMLHNECVTKCSSITCY